MLQILDESSKPKQQLVLLAEDDADTRRVLATALRVAGYSLVEAQDGLELMAILSSVSLGEAQKPDLVVTDILMPHFSGLEALRSSQRTQLDAPVVVITAIHDAAIIANALNTGAAALLEKPIDPDDLVATLSALAAGRAPLPPAHVL